MFISWCRSMVRTSERVDRIVSRLRYLVTHASGPLSVSGVLPSPLVAGDENALFRAIKALVREYAVAMYYTLPRSKSEIREFLNEPRVRDERVTYPSLRFFKLVPLERLESVYDVDPEAFGEMRGDLFREVTVFFVDLSKHIRPNFSLPLSVVHACLCEGRPTFAHLPAYVARDFFLHFSDVKNYKGPIRVYFKYTCGAKLSYYEPYKWEVIELVLRNYDAILRSIAGLGE